MEQTLRALLFFQFFCNQEPWNTMWDRSWGDPQLMITLTFRFSLFYHHRLCSQVFKIWIFGFHKLMTEVSWWSNTEALSNNTQILTIGVGAWSESTNYWCLSTQQLTSYSQSTVWTMFWTKAETQTSKQQVRRATFIYSPDYVLDRSATGWDVAQNKKY